MRAKGSSRRRSPLAAGGLLQGLPFGAVLDPDQVHALRRRAKRIRAALRLAEDAGRPRVRPVRRVLANAVRPLGPVRDGTVIAALAGKLALKLTDEAQLAARALEATPPEVRSRRWWAQRWRQLERAQTALRALAPASLTRRELKAAFKAAADRAARHARRSERHPSDLACAHEWRKSVQELRFQLPTAYPRESRAVARLAETLRKVARALGRAMDLTLLLAAVKTHRWPRDLRPGIPDLEALACARRTRALRHAHRAWPKARERLEAV